eukprot:scaffold28_cov312-Pinguiococcus_pyrenoidosus.AAC.6
MGSRWAEGEDREDHTCLPQVLKSDLRFGISGALASQHGDEEGEISLLNSGYSTTRFPFSYAWWSAFGWKRRCKSEVDVAESMPLVSQPDCYEACGKKIKVGVPA